MAWLILCVGGGFICTATARATAGEPAAEGPVEAGSSNPFNVQEYRVLGNHVLDARTIEGAVYPHLGPGKVFADVEAARAALETAYHEHGYGTVFVDVPEQTIENGVVRLRVTEGRLHSTTFTGAKYFSTRQIRAAIPAAAVGTVPSLPALQAQIGAVNAVTPDRSIVPVLKAGPEPGTMDLTFKVNDRLPFHGYVDLNNQYTYDTKPLRSNVFLSYDNLFGKLDSATLQYQIAPQKPSEASVIALGVVVPAGQGKVAGTFIDSSSNAAALGALAVIGAGKIYGVRYDQPIVATPAGVQTVSVGFDYKRFGQNVETDPTTVVESPVSYGLVTLSYAGTHVADRQIVTWSGSTGMALRGVGSTAAEFSDKCYQCRPNFFLVRADASLDQHLPHGFEAIFRTAGQYAVEPLPSNEQFLLGGVQTIRGYYEAEELGDIGLRGELDLYAPSLVGHSDSARLAPFVFTDGGRIGFQAPLPSQPANVTLSSVGAGLDIRAFRSLYGNLTWARVLHTGAHTERGDDRILFDVRGVW